MNTKLVVNIIISIAIIVAFVLSYFYIIESRDEDEVPLAESDPSVVNIFAIQPSNTETSFTSNQITVLLNRVKDITLNIKLFDDPAFKNLEDITVDIKPEDVGIDNPFTDLI